MADVNLANLRGSLSAILEYLDGTCPHTTAYEAGCYLCDARQSAQRALDALRGRLTVHVVYTEYQNGEPSIVGLYPTEAAALAAAEAEIVTQETEYRNVVFNHTPPDADPDSYDDADWDVDVHIEAHEVEA